MRIAVKIIMALILIATSYGAQAANIWYEDNNLGNAGGMPIDFMDKFKQPACFKEATGYIDVYMIRSLVLDKMEDKFLANDFKTYINGNKIKLAINAGGATWTQRGVARKKIRDNELNLLNRLKRLDIQVNYISLQSVLSKSLKDSGKKNDYSLSKRIEDIIAYSRSIREIYPQVEIGIIDALPSHNSEYQQPYRLLRDSMAKEGIILSYIHLDMPFEIPKEHHHGITWNTIREVERYVEDDIGLQFGYFTTTRKHGHVSSKAFHHSVIADLECYAGSGGTPRDYIIASWFPYPEKTIPETASGDDYPAMRTVKEFGRLLNTIEKGGSSWAAQRTSKPDWNNMCGMN